MKVMRIVRLGLIAAILLGGLPVRESLARKANSKLADVVAHMLSHGMCLSVINGRITLEWTQPSELSGRTTRGTVVESFRLVFQDGHQNLFYEHSSEEYLLTVTVTGTGDTVVIRHQPRGKSTFVPMEYSQAPGRKITLSLGDGDRRQTFSGNELWHLLFERPQECEQHLLPLLDSLHPGWRLAETAKAVEGQMLYVVNRKEAVRRRERWEKLVGQLGDDSYAKREAADRALRADSPAVLEYLCRLDFDQLDAEQQFRIRRMFESLDTGNDDTASVKRTATRLASDPAVWLVLLSRPDRECRKIAAQRLSFLLGEAIDIDPLADPETQRQRRDQLRVKIETRERNR